MLRRKKGKQKRIKIEIFKVREKGKRVKIRKIKLYHTRFIKMVG